MNENKEKNKTNARRNNEREKKNIYATTQAEYKDGVLDIFDITDMINNDVLREDVTKINDEREKERDELRLYR